MQDEVNEKVVSLAIKTSKLTAEVLQKAMKALLAKGKGQLTKAPHGKITMRQLMKPGEKVSNIEITDQNIKAFDPIARKNGLDYNVKKIENGKPPTYLVSFKGKDIDVMTEAFREFTAKKLGRDKKPSIRKLLSTLKDKAAALNAQRDKQLMTEDEIAVMDGGKCILQLRGVRPFFSDKYDITKHPNYKYLSDYDKKNTFDMEKHLRRRPALVKPDEVFDYYEISESDLQEDTDHE